MAYGAQQPIEMACGQVVFGKSAATRHRKACTDCQADEVRQAEAVAHENLPAWG